MTEKPIQQITTPTRQEIEAVLSELRVHAASALHWTRLIDLVQQHLRAATQPCSDGRPRASAIELSKKFSEWASGAVKLGFAQSFVLLAQAIEIGRTQYGWKICAPPIPVALPRLASAIQSDMPTDYERAQIWRQTLEYPASSNDARLGLGRLVLSLLFDSGVCSMSLLRVVLQQIERGVHSGRDLHWVNVTEFDSSGGTVEFRRVFLVPATALLAIRFGGRLSEQFEPGLVRRGTVNKKVFNQTILDAAVECIRKRGTPVSRCPKTLSALLKAASAALWTDLPGFLAAFASGTLRSNSISEPSFIRLMNLHGNDAGIAEPPTSSSSAADQPHDGAPAEFENPFAQDILERIDRALSERNARALIGRLDQTIVGADNQIPPSAQALMSWARNRVANIKDDSRAVPTEISRDVMRIAALVVGFFGLSDPMSLSTRELIDARDQLIGLIGDVPRPGPTARTIAKFVAYCAEYGVVKAALSRMPTEAKAPDANLFSLEEFAEFARVILKGHIAIESRDMGLSILTYLSAGLCSLRSSEARGLTSFEIEGDDVDSILIRVRVNHNRGLKTITSERNAFGVIAGPGVAKFLVEMRDSRESDCKGDSLFGEFAFKKPNEDWKIGRPAEALLKEVTGDPTLRPYHARHSAANRLLVGFAIHTFGLKMPEGVAFFDEAAESAKLVMRMLSNRFDLRRDLLRVVSLAMGHATPQTTVRHYIHLLDILLYATIRSRIPQASEPVLVADSGLPRSTAYRAMQRDGVSGLLRAVEDKFPDRVIRYSPKATARSTGLGKRDLYSELSVIHSELSMPNELPKSLRSIEAGLQRLSSVASGRRGSVAPRHPMVNVVDPDGQWNRSVPEPLTTVEDRSAALILCKVLERIPLDHAEGFVKFLDYYAQGAEAMKPRIRFPNVSAALEAVNLFQRTAMSGGDGLKLEWERDRQSDSPGAPTWVRIRVQSANGERSSRVAIRWVFQMLAGVQLGRHS